MAFSDPTISFGSVGLTVSDTDDVNNPTGLAFSGTGNSTLFVTQQDGTITRFELESQADNDDSDDLPQIVVTDTVKIDLASLLNGAYDDDGSISGSSAALNNQQITGIVATTDDFGNDVLYVSSSDPRIAVGTDSGLDTNSGQIHRITLDPDTGALLEFVTILRGLPRSEENHSTNGLDLSTDPVTGDEILWIAQGGNTNKGAPGNNFAGTVDFTYSGALLKLNLTAMESYEVQTDSLGNEFLLELPTLDDPTRTNVDLTQLDITNPDAAPDFTLDAAPGADSSWDFYSDAAGGNNGLNMAKITDTVLVKTGEDAVTGEAQYTFVDNPLEIYAPGFRNQYDVEVTEDGEVYTWDNGPNGGWGGQPLPLDDANGGDPWVEDWTTELATNQFNEGGSSGYGDQLHYVGDEGDQFGAYGGDANPLRASAEIIRAAYDADGNYQGETDSDPILDANGLTIIFANKAEADDYVSKLLIIYEKQNVGGTTTWVDVTSNTGLPADFLTLAADYAWSHPGSSIDDPTATNDGNSIMDGTFYSVESQTFDPNNDGSLKTVNASTNGLAEYTATFFGGALDGAIVAASFNGNLYFEMPVDTDGDGRTDAVDSLGTIGGFGSQPLTVETLGDDGFGGDLIDVNGDGIDDFAGIIAAATYGADTITFFLPGGEPVDPSTDLDLDGQNNTVDAFVGDPLEGKGVIVGANETALWDFELNNPSSTPAGAKPSGDSIVGDIGINGVWRNGVTPQFSSDLAVETLYNDGVWNLGGASSFASIDLADDGSAEGTVNDQTDVLGIGFAAPSGIGGVKILTKMNNAFDSQVNLDAGKTWDGGEKFGLVLGPGNQTTFVQAAIVAKDDGGTIVYGLELLVEENDVNTSVFVEMPGIESADTPLADGRVELEINVDMSFGSESVVARARFDDGGLFGDWFETSALDLPDDVAASIRGQYSNLGKSTGSFVGLLSTTEAGDDSFFSQWDSIEITGVESEFGAGEILYRWNAGASTVDSIDGGPDWVNTSATVVGTTQFSTQPSTSLDPSVPDYAPLELYGQELYGSGGGAAFGLEFGGGLLSDGIYEVNLFLANGFAGTSAVGQRVYDVSIEDVLVLDDLDLVETFGHQVGGFFTFQTILIDGTIDIDFAGSIENPLINAVEIRKLSGPAVSVLDTSAAEGDGTISVTIESDIAVPAADTITVNFVVTPISATPLVDYESAGLTYDGVTGTYSGSVEIAGGSADATVIFDLIDDAEIELDETFQIDITSVTGANATIGTGSAVLTIEDDDVGGPTGTVIYRVNAGGDVVAAIDGGIAWEEDRSAATTGGTATIGTPSPYVNSEVADTTFGANYTGPNDTGAPDELFDTERYSVVANPNNMQWDFAVENGDYLVNLYFVETWTGAQVTGVRVFDVQVEGVLELDDFDIVEAYGWQTAGTVTISTTVSDGNLDVDFIKGVQNPALKAIEIIQIDSDAAITVDVLDLTVSEDAGTAQVLFALSAPVVGGPVTVSFTVGDPADTAGASDYFVSGVYEVTFQPGEQVVAKDIQITNDTIVEGDETLTVTLDTITDQPGTSVEIGDGSATVTITDNDVSAEPEILYRVNVGGDLVASIDDGPDWVADTLPIEGGGNTYNGDFGNAHPGAIDTTDESIPVGTPGEIFNTERWDPGAAPEMTYHFDIDPGTTVEVRLYFAELFGGNVAEGDRVFDVAIEGTIDPAFDDIDQIAIAGAKGGFMRSTIVTVSDDGILDITGIHIPDGDNPAFKAIEIITVPDGPSATDDFANGVNVGDFSQYADNPTVVALNPGVNEIKASQEGDPNRDYDYVTINVPDGHVLTAINLADYFDYDDAQVNATFLGMQAGTEFTELPAAPDPTNMLGGVVYDELDIGADLLTDMGDGVVEGYGANTIGFETPLEAGDYTLWFSQNGAQSTTTLNFVVEEVVAVGSAVLKVTAGGGIQISNFGAGSFELTNTGEKAISKVVIDVTNAIYEDAVFDPEGIAGDTVSKELTIDNAGGTGVFAPTSESSTDFDSETATYIGAGGSDGYEGIVLRFNDQVMAGFNSGETILFSADMDPNSIAGMTKGPLDSGSSPAWDVGGISGAELIGSTFTIYFEDGTTAEGMLQSDGSLGGSQGLATQAPTTGEVSLTVNGVAEGGTGFYSNSAPEILVEGTDGMTARVVLTIGMIQPEDNNFTGATADQLDAQLAELAASDFAANNAAHFQVIDVPLNGTVQDISGLFNVYDVPGFAIPNEGTLPIGFTVSLIDPANSDLPISPVADAIYLEHLSTPYVANSEGDIVFEVEDAGLSDQGNWTYYDNHDQEPGHDDFTGSGYYRYEGANQLGTGGTSTLSYEFIAPETGVYYVNLRGSRFEEENPTEKNDSYVRIIQDGEPIDARDGFKSTLHEPDYSGPSGSLWLKAFQGGGTSEDWLWANKNVDDVGIPIAYELVAGETYTFQISGRSQGHEIDRVSINFIEDAPDPALGETTNAINPSPSAPLSPVLIPLPEISVAAVAAELVESGDEGSQTAVEFTVSLDDAGFAGDIGITYNVDIDGAVTEVTETVTFDGVSDPTVSVLLDNDNSFTADRAVSVTLVSATGATVDITPAAATVTDDDLGPTPGEVLYRVNAGGPDVAAGDASLPVWDQANNADLGPHLDPLFDGTNFATSSAIDISGLASVPQAVEALFKSERYGDTSWDFVLAEEGEYRVNLYFAEIFATAENVRLFDVTIEDELVLDDYDIFADVGNSVGTIKSFDVTMSADDLTIDVDFTTVADNAKISAIEIVALGPLDTIAPLVDSIALVEQPLQGATDPVVVEVVISDSQTAIDLENLTLSDFELTLDGLIIVPSDFDVIASADGQSVTVALSVLPPATEWGADPVEIGVEIVGEITDGSGNPVALQSDTVTVTPIPPLSSGATVAVNGSTTFGNASFVITNTSDVGVVISDVTFDLGTATLSYGLDQSGDPGTEFLGATFDPQADAGDAGGQGLIINASFSNEAGLLDENGVPIAVGTDVTTSPYPFSNQLPGGNEGAPGGFTLMDLTFADFASGEAIQFGVDIDPQSIQGAFGTGGAGAVSGGEIAGTTVTITFVNELTNETWTETRQLEAVSTNGSEAVFDDAPVIAAPTLEIVGLTEGGDRRVKSPSLSQSVAVTGATEGDTIRLYIYDTSGYVKDGDDGTEAVPEDTFHANQFDKAPVILEATADASGAATFAVELIDVAGAAPATLDGLFFFSAGIVGADGTLDSLLSEPAELALREPQNTSDPIALPDEFSTPENQTVFIPFSVLLANDFDPDGSVEDLTVIDVATTSSEGALITVVEEGITALYGPPDTTFTGVDTFTYTIEDLDGNQAIGTVLVNVTANIVGSSDPDLIDGTDASERFYGDLGGDTINAFGGDDIIFGLWGDDIIDAGAGNDQVSGEGDNDMIMGGSGLDFLYGGLGNDTIMGGDDTDAIFGQEDDDTLYGDGAGDNLDGGLGEDKLFGGAGNDWVFGQEGDDELYGGDDTDALWGGDDNDILMGEGGGDGLDGGDGDDNLDGGEGIDYLYGQGGNDTLWGGADLDALFGGADSDTFIFKAGGDEEQVFDFEDGIDLIDVSSFAAGLADLNISDNLTHLEITTTAFEGSMLLIDLAGATLTEDDFIFQTV